MPKKFQKIEDLSPDRKNPNKHTEKGGGLMEKSLRECGFGDSLTVDKNGAVISGNQRLETLAQLGFSDPIFVESDGTRPVVHIRTDLNLDSDERARLLSIYQNRVGELNLDWNIENMLASTSREKLDELFSKSGVSAMLAALAVGSNGSLLDLADVTIKEPSHKVNRHEKWHLGKHLLFCSEVQVGWSEWKGALEGKDTYFAPYPGPFVPLTLKAQKSKRVVMVQPDPYICGHILDRYVEVFGKKEVRRAA